MPLQPRKFRVVPPFPKNGFSARAVHSFLKDHPEHPNKQAILKKLEVFEQKKKIKLPRATEGMTSGQLLLASLVGRDVTQGINNIIDEINQLALNRNG